MHGLLGERKKRLPSFTAGCNNQLCEGIREALFLSVEEYAHLLLQLNQHTPYLGATLLSHFSKTEVSFADGLHHMLAKQMKDPDCYLYWDLSLTKAF